MYRKKKVICTVTDAKPMIAIQKKNRSSSFDSLPYENIREVFRIVSKAGAFFIHCIFMNTTCYNTHAWHLSSSVLRSVLLHRISIQK